LIVEFFEAQSAAKNSTVFIYWRSLYDHQKHLKGLEILAGLFVLIQLIPYGRDHANPPVVSEPTWANPQTRILAQRACFDCHSNQTIWPWYSSVAPVSWLIAHDVQDGRRVINFSDWTNGNSRGGRFNIEDISEISKAIKHNSMPPFYYTLIHTDAGLTTTEKDQLITGLQSTISTTQ